MGRITSSVTLTNPQGSQKAFRCDALVDTKCSFLVLPSAWKDRLGELELLDEIELETATQATVKGEICGPVKIQIEGFRSVYGEVAFVEMTPQDGLYEPLLGYIVLERSQRLKSLEVSPLDVKQAVTQHVNSGL